MIVPIEVKYTKKTLLIVCLFTLIIALQIYNELLPFVNAPDDGTVNFTALPDALLVRLQLPSLYVARILATMIVLLIACAPFALFGKVFITFIVAQVVLTFSTAIGWLDGWVMLLIAFLTAGLFSFGFLKSMFD